MLILTVETDASENMDNRIVGIGARYSPGLCFLSLHDGSSHGVLGDEPTPCVEWTRTFPVLKRTLLST